MPNVPLKTPKGTRDWFGPDVILRDHIFDTVTNIFKQHGAEALDTPVFELKEVLMGKYGEDSKLIYDLADQQGEISSLRYDLTIPFARWLAQNKVEKVRRYHIAKVYRRDQPAIARGRMREFWQCDFDIAGETDPMIAESEILRIIFEVFRALKLDVTVKLNHRRILSGVFAVAGLPTEQVRTVSAEVDKLDKMAWVDVRKAMVETKGVAEDVADKIGEYVQHKGTITEMLEKLKDDAKLMTNDDMKAGLQDMALLGTYLKAMKAEDKISFDLSLARGLDYYTGVIYECIVAPSPAPVVQGGKKSKEDPANTVGSIAAGGRYDELVGIFGKRPINCIGISFGVDRIFTILKSRQASEQQIKTETEVYVMSFGDGLLLERMEIASELWDGGIRAEFTPKVKPKLPQQFKLAENIPLAVILGRSELDAGQVKLKVLGLDADHPEKEGVLVQKVDIVTEVQKKLSEIRLSKISPDTSATTQDPSLPILTKPQENVP